MIGATLEEMVMRAFRYEDGALFWNTRPLSDFASVRAYATWNRRHAGTRAGWMMPNGYHYVRIGGKILRACRVVWLLHHGRWPQVIDHVDGVTGNDRIGNLRDVSQGENCKNKRRGANNTSGMIGVERERGKWRATIGVGGQRKYLGSFPTFEAASAARKLAEVTFGYHPNHGRAVAEATAADPVRPFGPRTPQPSDD